MSEHAGLQLTSAAAMDLLVGDITTGCQTPTVSVIALLTKIIAELVAECY